MQNGTQKKMTFGFHSNQLNTQIECSPKQGICPHLLKIYQCEQCQKPYDKSHPFHSHQNESKLQIQENKEKLLKVSYFSSRSMEGFKPYTKLLKENQDTIFNSISIQGRNDLNIFLLADGYGKNGALISKFIVNYISKQILKKIEEQQYNQLSIEYIRTQLTLLFQETEVILENESKIDISISGSTLNASIIFKDSIISANVGNTKSYYYQQNEKKEEQVEQGETFLKIKQLSSQHTPEKDLEMQRIISSGGKIEQECKGIQKLGALKVKSKRKLIEGTYITRSFGDLEARQFGIISEPYTSIFQVEKSGFLVMVTGGILEKIDIIDINRILISIFPPTNQYSIDEAAGMIINEARKKAKQDPDCLDDFSIILVYLELEQN